MHVHGIALLLWCLLLIVQPYLIRTKRNGLHKQVGKFSYLLVPIIAYSTVDLYKFRLRELTALSTRDYLFTASVLNALLTFLIFYGLAIYFRKSPAIHARYMVCTVFALFTAVIDRIIRFYFSFLLPYRRRSRSSGGWINPRGYSVGSTKYMGLAIAPKMEYFSHCIGHSSSLSLFRS